MRIIECLRCRQRALMPTGGFWLCGECGYAITYAALCAEAGGHTARPLRKRSHEHGTRPK
ncbi:hypothetical protein [Candidatus Nitrospira bockiana]